MAEARQLGQRHGLPLGVISDLTARGVVRFVPHSFAPCSGPTPAEELQPGSARQGGSALGGADRSRGARRLAGDAAFHRPCGPARRAT